MNKPQETNVNASAHEHGPFSALGWGLRRDLTLAMRSQSELAVVLIFFLLVTSLFPLAISPDPKLLAKIAPGIAWIAALLASLLALPYLFASDHTDGSLEQIVLSSAPLPALIFGKVLAHWLTTAVPIILLTPLIAIQFGLTSSDTWLLLAALALGTPILAWLGAIGAALTLGAAGGASLLALLVLPLAVPVLVFGTGAVEAGRAGLGAQAHLSLLGAGFILANITGPFAAALAVRIAHE